MLSSRMSTSADDAVINLLEQVYYYNSLYLVDGCGWVVVGWLFTLPMV